MKRILPFKIIDMDSLGQGVSKESDKIAFISKSLPGDTGEAVINAERKGVAFGEIHKLEEQSELRIVPVCPHFTSCPSCHYLHTSYEDELRFKKINLERMLRKVLHPEIKVTPAKERLGYRNRVQLHYDVSKKKLGMLNASVGEIVPVSQCMIGNKVIQQEVTRLYQDQQWLKEVKGKPKGHVELYDQESGLKVSWNRPYAEGGFTQVYQEMNELLKAELEKWVKQAKIHGLLDLFAGNGNLSKKLSYDRFLGVDMYSTLPGKDFFSQDLYDKSAFDRIKKELKKRELVPDLILLDPPRSGFKDLKGWLEVLKPQRVVYVSCDPHTLVRDISDLRDYTIQEVHLIDFFPSTFHFETMIFLERKD